jgi:uncharacterized protein with FMN-binding domain
MEESSSSSNNNKIIAGVVVLVVVVLIVFGIAAFSKKNPTVSAATTSSNTDTSATLADSTNTASVATDTTAANISTASNSTYKDGTYTTTGNYNSPGGPESITVKVTLKSDIITDSEITSGARDDQAQSYQDAFISGYRSLVSGKSISSIKLSRVSGSSLTSQGFNNALHAIEQQAKA